MFHARDPLYRSRCAAVLVSRLLNVCCIMLKMKHCSRTFVNENRDACVKLVELVSAHAQSYVPSPVNISFPFESNNLLL